MRPERRLGLSSGRDPWQSDRRNTARGAVRTARARAPRRPQARRPTSTKADVREMIQRAGKALDEQRYGDARVPLLEALEALDRRGVTLPGAFESGPPAATEDVSLAVDVLTMMGDSHIAEMDAEPAVSAYGAAKFLLDATDGLSVSGDPGVKLVTKLAYARSEAQDVEGALRDYLQARDMVFDMGREAYETRTGAELLVRIGDMLAQLDELEEALQKYESALAMLESLGLPETKNDATLLANIAAIYAERGESSEDMDAALDMFEAALGIMERLEVLDTAEGAGLVANTGLALLQRGADGDVQRALGDLEYAHKWYSKSGTLETLEGAVICEALGDACKALGNLDAANKYYAQFQRIVVAGSKGDDEEAEAPEPVAALASGTPE